MDCRTVKVITGDHTASCFINTDLQDNQITAFYPGAMAHAASISLTEAGVTADDLVVIAPNDPAAMNRYASRVHRSGNSLSLRPFDAVAAARAGRPREGLPRGADPGGQRLRVRDDGRKTGNLSEADLRRLAPVTVMTRGEAGALITVGKEEFDIPPAKPRAVLDPTGAGDAFRAGFILGMKQGLPWPVVGRLAALSRRSTPSSIRGRSSTLTRSKNSWRDTRRTSGRHPRSRCRQVGRQTSLRCRIIFGLSRRPERVILMILKTDWSRGRSTGFPCSGPPR